MGHILWISMSPESRMDAIKVGLKLHHCGHSNFTFHNSITVDTLTLCFIIHTSYDGTHSLDQHVSGIKNGHNKSWPRKTYDISCSALWTLNIYICVALLFLVHPTLNAGLVNPLRGATTPKKTIKINPFFVYFKHYFVSSLVSRICGKIFTMERVIKVSGLRK